MDSTTLFLNFILPLVVRLAVVVMIVIMTVTLVRIWRVLKSRKGSGIQVVSAGGDESDAGYAGVDPQVVAAIAAAVTVMGQAEGKRLVVRSVRRADGWADAGRREAIY